MNKVSEACIFKTTSPKLLGPRECGSKIQYIARLIEWSQFTVANLGRSTCSNFQYGVAIDTDWLVVIQTTEQLLPPIGLKSPIDTDIHFGLYKLWSLEWSHSGWPHNGAHHRNIQVHKVLVLKPEFNLRLRNHVGLHMLAWLSWQPRRTDTITCSITKYKLSTTSYLSHLQQSQSPLTFCPELECLQPPKVGLLHTQAVKSSKWMVVLLFQLTKGFLNLFKTRESRSFLERQLSFSPGIFGARAVMLDLL